ncbi:TonB-dependent receptor [uncultured Microbulbifer sp.]|uniref:TonB-dependent receptor n=1 Tax=uncultured Microbulbifer sp. TaxID=348147 RepID=UPI0026191402|nr:TonB-dependent receptor [uncultured Microbulbifer sp.]
MSTSTVRNRFRMSALSVAVLSVCSGQAFAQEDETEDQSQYEALEEVQVTGIRASIEKSIDDKRYGGNIKDTINAEDIGKTTDQNIAEALSRVTGVSMQTSDGEGTTITVRGANAQQNNISLNGVQLGATDFSQAVDLSAYSADILSKIEVVKTPSADHDEGSLGANINLVSAKPLEVSEGLNINAQGRYNDLADDQGHKISQTYTGKFFDDTLGVLVTAFDEADGGRKDQYRAESFTSYTSRIAKDQNGNVVNDVTGIVPSFSNLELAENQRDRQGVNVALQWQATDTTEINTNLSWNKQDIEATTHSIRTRIGDFANKVEGVSTPGMGLDPAEYSDPQENWHVYDTETRTFTKMLNRAALGDISQSENKFSNVNKIASFDITQEIGDSIVVSGGVGYSSAEQIPDQSLYVNLQNYANINAWVLQHATPEDLEPVGFDCTSGVCELIGGTGEVDHGETPYPDTGAVWDNYSTTGFNPDDLGSQHLSYLARTVRAVEDTQKSAYIDVDWDVDFAGVHQLEFGAKFSNREKFVDNQTGAFFSVGEGVVIVDPETGQRIATINGLQDISGSLIQSGEFPANDFMESLGFGRNNITDGWTTISAQKAFEVAQGNPDAHFVPDDTETRFAELDNQAFYIKADFSFLDEKLSGDVGLRYVQTDVFANGYSGVNFQSDPHNLGRTFDPIKLAELRDSSLPTCADPVWYGANWDEEVRWSRVDGQGYDTKGTATKEDDTPLPDQGACYDSRAERIDPVSGEAASNWWLWRHSDLSTEQYYIYGERRYDENGQLLPTDDLSRRAFAVDDEHTYDVLLPSLNLNYVINDEMVGRLALSKTMSRPQIDSLRPGFKVTESVWGGFDRPGNIVTLTNTKLDPLESNNLDLSFEWYFAENSMFATGLFYKDMTNFEESQTIVTYLDDLRDLGLDENGEPYEAANLIKTADDLEGCMPRRILNFPELAEDWVYSDDLSQLCAQFQTTQIKNGKGAEILGAEFQYTQTYDMLPGVFSGLGTMFNYTYQDSAYDQEVSSLDPSVTLPELQVAYTPEHSYNATVFWEQNGHQLRLAYQGTSDQLAQRSWNNGALWQEGRNTLDFSATYALSDNFDIYFQATNLTDSEVRTYFTSRFMDLGDVNGAGESVAYDEGNPLDGDATTARTVTEYKTGRAFRLGVQARF